MKNTDILILYFRITNSQTNHQCNSPKTSTPNNSPHKKIISSKSPITSKSSPIYSDRPPSSILNSFRSINHVIDNQLQQIQYHSDGCTKNEVNCFYEIGKDRNGKNAASFL